MRVFDKQKIKDLSVYGFGQAVNLLSPLIVLPYLISICGEKGVGKIGVGFAFALILNSILDYGSYITGVKDISINRHDGTYLAHKLVDIYLSKVILFLIIVLVSVVLIFFIPFFADDSTLFLLSLSIVAGQMVNPAWFFQGTGHYNWLAFLNILSKAIYVGGIYLFIKTEQDLIWANLFFGLGVFASGLIGVLHITRKYSANWMLASFTSAVQILKTEFSFAVSQFFLSVYQYVPILVVSYVAGDYLAGQYRVIDQVVMIFKSYLNIFFYFIYAPVCYETARNLSHGLRVWRQFNGLNALMVFILITICFVNAEWIFTFFRIEPQLVPAISTAFRMALLVPVLLSVSVPLRQLVFAFNENSKYIKLTIAATIVNFVLLVVFTRHYGLEGTFSAIILIEFIIIVLYLLILRKHLSGLSKSE